MKTHTFLFWISILILFPHGLFSKSITNKEQYSIDSDNSNENNEEDVGSENVALHESFRPRHKYKSSGRQTRFYRSDDESSEDEEIKTPQCAVMYKDNEPVGILQPFKESYKFLPVSGSSTLVDINPVPVKRKTIMDVLYPSKINQDYSETIAENNNQFADDRYPSIFAKFKIDSRLDKTLNPDLNMKRSMYKRDKEMPNERDEQISPLKTTHSKMNGDNSAVVEEELKNILDDMGLIDDYNEKAEAKRDVAEDEDMEQGTNKINLIKEEHNETRNKRGDLNGTTVDDVNTASVDDFNVTETTLSTTATSAVVPTKVQFEEERTDEVDSIDLFKGDDAKLSDDSREDDSDASTEADLEQLRKRRQFEENKNQKRDTDSLPDINLNASSLVKETELNQYEKRVEREIRDKIKKLKEEVREEIENLKKNSQVTAEQSDTKRKKRQVVNSLLDEETQDIDPNLNDEEPHEEHHVRRKRSLSFEDSSLINKSEINNQIVYLSNLNDQQNDKQSNTNSEITNKINFKNNELSSQKQKNNNKDVSRFIINFGEIDPEIAKVIKTNSVNIESIQNKKETQEIPTSEAIKENYFTGKLNETNTVDLKNSSIEARKKKNIINMLTVIGKKRYNDNEYNSNRVLKRKIRLAKKIPKTNKIRSSSKTIKSLLDKRMQDIIHYEASNGRKDKRFIGINPILESANNSSNYTTQWDENRTNLELKNDGTVNAMGDFRYTNNSLINPTLGNINFTTRYNSRNLKQFDEDSIKENSLNGIHIRIKRSDEPTGTNDSNTEVHVRRKRFKNDLEESDYQEDEPEFNNAAVQENESNDDQPYTADNNVARRFGSSNVNSNCNCDKTDANCKCGTQKSDISVPNVKEDYSDYVESPNIDVEKKSINHCKCSKDGKHCQYQTFGEGAQYSDYAEEQPSVDLDNSGVLDELQGGSEERTPRRPRQRRPVRGSVETQDLTEDYYDDYDTEGNRLTKREAKLRKLARDQQFQSGEYFVDLHPNVYRLTPVDTSREKRDSFEDLLANHGGAPVMNHLVAIRQRSMLPHPRIRRRVQSDDNREARQLIDMSDEDIFGALPQSFAGELTRYKRVKRDKPEK